MHLHWKLMSLSDGMNIYVYLFKKTFIHLKMKAILLNYNLLLNKSKKIF